MTYYSQRRVAGDFDDVVERVSTALSDEGFGVLCDVDVAGTLEEKLGLEDYPRYRILGACNPGLAERALDVERDLGVLLPCNVVVYEDGGDVVVSAVDPGTLLSVVGEPDLDPIATDVRDSFERVLERVAGN